ncbi:RNA polymerase sigma factor, partial [Eggerthella lenta]|uniref:RNA polymerase sigma factor n=1 Tax=Eggerthella lenta TaxID=84112 RepID=UPI0034E400A0
MHDLELGQRHAHQHHDEHEDTYSQVKQFSERVHVTTLSAKSQSALQDSELGRALGRLPDKMRLIVHLHYYEGFSTEEIAR